MPEHKTYQAAASLISQQKMQFHVVNHHLAYEPQERRVIKDEMEAQLFAVFCKYECSD